MVNDANTNGGGFIPKAGEKIASIGQVTNCSPVATCNHYLPYQVFFIPATCPTCTGAVGDFVWKDLNDNGIQDIGEPGISGVEVKLTGTDAYGQAANLTTTADTDGKYQFNNLCASKDKYTVTINPATLPADVIPTINRSANGDDNIKNDSNEPNGTAVSVTTDSSINLTVDFGYTPLCTGSIGDFVWEDLDGNGIQDTGEPVIQGAVVSLTGTNVYGVPVPANTTATTDANGLYSFKGLCQGTYTVKVDSGIPAGFVPTLSTSSDASDLIPSDSNNPAGTKVILPSDTDSNPTADFGYKPNCQGTIGDFVWKDKNSNGIQDSGEPGIDGVKVTLLGTNGYGQLVNMTVTTDASGAYTFHGLCKGDRYTITIDPSTVPAGWGPTSPLVDNGTIRIEKDSNNPAGTTVALAVDNENNPTVDFGYVPICAGSIGDFVWNDKNVDGIQNDGADSGINGVQVQLNGTNIYGQPVNLSSTTANGGIYEFTKLCQGNYTVAINNPTVPAGFVATTSPSANGNDGVTNDSNKAAATSVSLPDDSTSNQTVDFGYYKPVPTIMVTETCDNAADPTKPITFTATVSNTGNETLTGITCTDTLGITQTVADILPGASGSTTFSYTGTTSPLSDGVTCSATGSISNTPVTATAAPTSCTITTSPAIMVAEECTNAADPTKPIVFSATVTNTGNEKLTGISCTDTLGTIQTVAEILPGAVASLTFSYVGTTSPLSDTVTCSAKGAISNTPVTATAAPASCTITTAPAIKVAETCANATDPTKPIVFTATVTNSGNETLTGVSCTDTIGTTQAVADIAVGASGSATFSYTGSTSPLSDGVTCSAKGAISTTPVTATAAATSCTITTAPAITLTETCTNAPAPGQPINIAAVITNTGNETLTGFSCLDSRGATMTGIPATLAPGAAATLSGSYVPAANGSTDILTCSAKGTINGSTVSATSSSTCGINTKTALTVTEDCTNAADPTKPIVFTATVGNTGNETLTGITCKDTLGSTKSLSDILPGASASVSFSYVQSTSPLSDTVTCSAKGAISATSVTTTSAAKSCTITPPPCIPCTTGVTNMTLRIETRTYNADPNERVRVRADSMTGAVLYDSWYDNVSGSGLSVGTNFSFVVPAAVSKVVVTLQGRDHPSEYLKATFSANCDLVVGTINGAYPSYITFKVVDASFDGPKTCSAPTCTGTIGDFVWNDANKNGIQDLGETGIAGAVVTLTGTDFYNKAINKTITTPTSGAYQFTGLCQGTYKVTATTPSGYTPTSTGKGTTATDSNSNPTTVTLANNSDTTNQTIDFGYYKTCTQCTNGVTNMTLQLYTRTYSADPNERVRVHADSMSGAVLYDSWNDGIYGNGLSVGSKFSFAVPAAAKQVVVTLQGKNHYYETVKATFSAECSLVIPTVNGVYPSYIQFKVIDATFDGDKTCTTTCGP